MGEVVKAQFLALSFLILACTFSICCIFCSPANQAVERAFGAKMIPLNKKGANAIECANGYELVNTLKSLKQAVMDDELDDGITEVSLAMRLALKK